MATILTDLALRLYAQTSELKKGLKEAGNSAKNFSNSTKSATKAASGNFKQMSKEAGGALTQMTGGLAAFSGATPGAVGGFKALAGGARTLMAALGPIGLILGVVAAAIKAVQTYFTGTIEGANKFAKIMGFLEGALSVVRDAFIKFGEIIVWVFENPREAIKQLWEAIKQNIVNRFEGLVSFFVNSFEVIKNGFKGVALSIKGLFNDEAREEAKQYFEQMGKDLVEVGKSAAQMATGFDVEEVLQKGKDVLDELNTAAKEGASIAAARKQLEWDILYATLRESKARGEIADLVLKTRDLEGTSNEERQAALTRALELERSIGAEKLALAERNFELAKREEALGEGGEKATQDRIKAEIELNKVRKESADKERELVNRQNEFTAAVQAFIDAGIDYEKMTFNQAKAELKLFNERKALYEKAKEVGIANYEAMSTEELEIAISSKEEEIAKKKKLEDDYANYVVAKADEAATKSRDAAIAREKERFAAGEINEDLYRARLADINAEWDAKDAEAAKKADEEALAREEEAAARRQEIRDQAFEAAATATEALANIFEAAKQRELKAAGDNEKKKEEINKKYAKRDKALAITKAVIGTALAVINALQTQPFLPMGPIMAAVAAAAGAAQIAAIAATPLAKGGIATKPTLAMIGEYPGASANPEVVAPLDKLQRMIGGVNGGEVVFKIEYDQLVGVLDNGAELKSAY